MQFSVRTSDGRVAQVPASFAQAAGVLRRWWNDAGDDVDVVPLPGVEHAALHAALQHHGGQPVSSIVRVAGVHALVDLLHVASYLDMPHLKSECVDEAAKLLIGRTEQQVEELFAGQLSPSAQCGHVRFFDKPRYTSSAVIAATSRQNGQ